MSLSTADTLVNDQVFQSPDPNFDSPVQQLQTTATQALMQGICEVPQTPAQSQTFVPQNEPNLDKMENATTAVLQDIATFGPAKGK